MLLPLLLNLTLIAPSAAVTIDDCDYEDTRSASLTGASALRVEAGAGTLRVEGRADASAVRVEARLCASSRRLLDDMELETGVRDGRAEVVTVMPDRTRGSSYARMDLVIVVPHGMPARIVDGSGAMWLGGLGATRIEDGSGSVEVVGVRGSLEIEDGSGSLHIRDVSGDVEIDDGSGGIVLAGIQGNVLIDDGSGDIAITDVRRDVLIDDSSGSIRVDGVGGDFTVSDDGSGGIRHTGVQGSVRVPPERRGD